MEKSLQVITLTLDELEQLIIKAVNTAVEKATERLAMPEVLKSADVKALLGCSDSTLQTLRLTGQLNPTQIGGTWYYNAKELRDMLPKYEVNR
jgi:hypothetical protein